MNTFKENHTILWHNVDFRHELKPYAFLNLMQEIAGKHADKLHFGYDDLKESEQTWVLSRIKVHFNSYPKWQEKVTLETWHKGMLSLFGLRDFILYGEDGNQAVVATSSWLIMNSKTRRIERANNFYNNPEILNQANTANAIDEPCDKLKSQPDMVKIREHIVKYSDLDALGHTNNAKYSEWITDSLPIDIYQNFRIREFQINFNAETKLGDTIEIYSSRMDNGAKSLYFEGRREGKAAFEALLTLDDAADESSL